jgi:hypothetical protein
MPPTDDTLRPGEQLVLVARASDLVPGSVIRIWHPDYQRWIPGWWGEVLRVEGERVYLRDLQSGEQSDRHVKDTVNCAYMHPAPERLREMGEAREEAQQATLDALRAEYEALDFAASTEAEMIEVLRSEMEWRRSHSVYNMKDEFEIRSLAITGVGRELDRRGGMALMRRVFERVPGDRSLEMVWDGIGYWSG